MIHCYLALKTRVYLSEGVTKRYPPLPPAPAARPVPGPCPKPGLDGPPRPQRKAKTYQACFCEIAQIYTMNIFLKPYQTPRVSSGAVQHKGRT